MPPNGGNFSGPKYIEAYNAQRWFEPRVREIQWWLQREALLRRRIRMILKL